MSHWRLRRHRAPAIANTAAILHILCVEWWQMPAELEQVVLGALMESRYSRAVDLKRQLAVIQGIPTRMPRFLAQHLTPTACVALVEDLRHEGLLTRQQASAAEEYILAVTSKEGTWIGNDDPGPQAA